MRHDADTPVDPPRQSKLDQPGRVRKQVAWPRPERREAAWATPHLDDDRAAAHPLGDVPAVSHDQLQHSPPNAQGAELEPAANRTGHAHLHRHADTHLHADARAAGAPRGQEDERGAIARGKAASRRRTQRHRTDGPGSDDHTSGPHENERRSGRRPHEPRGATHIQREPHRANGQRHGRARVVRHVQGGGTAGDECGPRRPHDEPGPARGAGLSRRRHRQNDERGKHRTHGQRGITV